MEREHRTSHVPSAEGDLELVPVSRTHHESRDDLAAAHQAAADPDVAPGAPRIRRLIADQKYFGLAARVFRGGADRMLERIGTRALGKVPIDLDSLGADFRLKPAECFALLRAMEAGGLLIADGTGYYRPTARFREYALAPIVAPLSRARARALIDAVRSLAAKINADWARNPFEIRMVAVSGSYMSRSDQLPELSLWLVLRQRRASKSRRWRPLAKKSEGLRQILTAVSALSSFIQPRIVAHRSALPRPFCLVFEADAAAIDAAASTSWSFRDWGQSISQLLSPTRYASRKRRQAKPTRDRGTG